MNQPLEDSAREAVTITTLTIMVWELNMMTRRHIEPLGAPQNGWIIMGYPQLAVIIPNFSIIMVDDYGIPKIGGGESPRQCHK